MPGFPAAARLSITLAATLIAAVGFAQDTPSQRPAWTTSRIVGSPNPPEPYRLLPFAASVKFQRPTCVEQIPSSNRLLVTEMSGKIYTLDASSKEPRAELAGDLAQMMPESLKGRGVSLFDAECHFDFRNNGWLFLCYVHPGEGGHTRVSRFELTRGTPPQIAAESEQVFITWPSGGHNGGCLEFAPNGYMHISTGDGSGPNPPDGLTTGQTVNDLLGAVLRIDVNQSQGEKPYRVPDDNPFVGMENARPEIWGYGLRNPWKFGVDPKSGEVFVADNGWESWEMVHHVGRGGNCGWPVMEGRVALRTEVPVGPTPIIPPLKDHPHSEANSVIGGPVYRGDKLPGLDGAFVYGDYITGTIWAVQRNANGDVEHQTLVDTDQRIVAFTETAKGELLVLDYDYTGQIYELVPSELPDTSASFPRRLSETGIFVSLENLQPAAGVVPYSVLAERWMDGAVGQRWIAIPGNASVDFGANEPNQRFPDGTVLVKHLSLPSGSQNAIPLETQILHYERGSWRPYSYVWDDRGDEATLVESIGKKRPLNLSADNEASAEGQRTWHVSAVNECKLCHNAESGFVLGFAANQLNRKVRGSIDREPFDQLAHLRTIRVVQGSNTSPDATQSQLVDPHDSSKPIEDRARSYLHANCAMCHQPAGNAIVSFYLRRDLPFDKLNTNKGTGIGTFGIRDAKIITPGDPFRSILVYRMSKLGYARMPYIGSHLVDGKGVSLVEQWIRSIEGQSSSKSGPASEGSVERQSIRRLLDPPSRDTRLKEAVQQLLESTEGALAMSVELHREALSPEARRMAIAAGNSDPRADIRGLFQTFLPESQRKVTLGATTDPREILSREGDSERGKLIFFSDTARCRACHELDDPTRSLGPTLKEVVKKYPKQDELLQHVLQPSLKIDEPLAAHAVVTRDGMAIVGLLIEQTDSEVVLKTAEKKLVRLPRTEIESMGRSSKSLMPDFVLGDLTAQEAADLFAYIRSIGKLP